MLAEVALLDCQNIKIMTFIEKLRKPIPVGRQDFAYQCENISIEPSFGEMLMRGYVPFKGGKEPYDNLEKDSIEHYELNLKRFTGNSLSVSLLKKFKDGSEVEYDTTMSFSFLVNRIFDGLPVTMYEKSPPRKDFL